MVDRAPASALAAVVIVAATQAVASAPASPAPPAMTKVDFREAPRQIQRDLTRVLESCGVPAREVRAKARLDIGPIGGPGRRDYFFESQPGAGDSRVSLCTGNYVWQLFWMQVADGRYRLIERENDIVFANSRQSLLFDVKCASRETSEWWNAGRFKIWHAGAGRFRPVSRCLTLVAAQAWARAHGYVELETY